MDLSVTTREKFGKAVKTLRSGGFIPAELYGHGVENVHLVVGAKDFLKVFKEAGTNTIVNLLVEPVRGREGTQRAFTSNGVDKKGRFALIHDVQKDYLTDNIVHVDFYQVQMSEKIKAKVPLEFLGEAPAVKEKAGVLNRAMLELEVEALPADLPHRLSVDLAALDDLNKSIYVKDIKIPKGVKILIDAETVVATVTPPAAEEEKVVEAPVDVSAVKVETEEKKAERARLASAPAEREAGKTTKEKEE